jgi:hypothetical protein
MSLAVLARKTRTTAPRFRRDKCFVLNMTGRGQVIGQSAKSHNSKCKTKQGCKDGHVSRCCGAANSLDLSGCKSDCWRGKGSRPAPQLSYSNYLNRRSLGSYRPGGRVCCDTSENQKNNKITWKQGPSISASEMIQQRKDNSVACWKQPYSKKYSIKNIDTFESNAVVSKWKWTRVDINYWKQRLGKCLDVIIEVDSSKLYKYEMKVGTDGAQYGFDGVGSGPNDRFGELCPNKQVLGYTINTLRINAKNFKFAVDTNNEEGPKRCDIKNIYLVDKVEKTSEKTKPCAVKTISSGNNLSGRNATDLVSYTRINHVSCGTTKTLPYSSSGDQIAFRRATSGCPKYGLASFKRPMKKN